MNDEVLRIFMCEAEVVVNSRLLIVEGIILLDIVESLTLNYFLILKIKVVLFLSGKFIFVDLYLRKWWRRV